MTYDKMQSTGAIKRVTEPYLFDSISFTEAEARAIEELAPYISGEFTVKTCKRTNIAEIFFDEASDKFYLAKVRFITLDEKMGTERGKTAQILVQARNFEGAVDHFKAGMKGTMADWELVSISETPIIEVYPLELS